MQVNSWLQHATQDLERVDIASAHLDALILLEDATNKDRGWLLAHPEFELDKNMTESLDAQIMRRSLHEPLAYIRGKSEFYGRSFIVSPATLQPRSETETMIEMLKDLKIQDNAVIADIGTGSGCIAITVKLEWPKNDVHATELNKDALKIAKQNTKKLKADVTFKLGNLIEPLTVHPDILLCNLPYVPDAHTINKAAMQEPKIAIFGGDDGLDLYRELFTQIKDPKPDYILTESLPFQHIALAKIAQACGYTQTNEEDFIQVFSATR